MGSAAAARRATSSLEWTAELPVAVHRGNRKNAVDATPAIASVARSNLARRPTVNQLTLHGSIVLTVRLQVVTCVRKWRRDSGCNLEVQERAVISEL
jgi:hypothetical protein